MTSPRIDWTQQQREAVGTVGRSVLVSAAAGSGKTAVLAERCAHLVCDARDCCDIDQLLVLTFTESAAASMKARIQEALRQRLAQRPSDRLARQLALVEHAHVSTVHGFCARLLRQNFNLAGLDPEFQILDGDEAALLRLEVATDLFHRRYETDQTGDFQRLIDAYGDGDDQKLIAQVVSTHNLLCSLVDPNAWITDAQKRIADAAGPLESSALGRELLEQVHQALDALARSCIEASNSIAAIARNFAGYVDQLGQIEQFLGHCRQVLRTDGLDMLVSEWRDFCQAAPPAPTIAANVPGKALAKSLLDGVKDALRDGTLAELLALDGEQWRAGMAQLLPHAQAFLSLVWDFREQYDAAKRSARRLDFADLERLTLQILQKSEELVGTLHGQFRHVLVDEYQDINEIQDAILARVSREHSGGSGQGNLFCVGDVKQSIFRFRLAEPRQFLERQMRFRSGQGGVAIDLRENFRSRAPLLEAINAVFRRLLSGAGTMIQYDQSHQLRAGKNFPPAPDTRAFSGAPIELHLLPTDLEIEDSEETPEIQPAELERAQYEAILVARQIRKMTGKDGSPPRMVVDADSGAYRPIELRDIVVLLRAMRFKADVFADALRGHGIAVHSEGGAGFFQAVEVRDLLCLLQVLDNFQQDIPLAAVLRSPLAAIPDADDALARIRLAYPDESIPFHDAVARYAREQDDELAAKLADFLQQLDDWRDQANKRPVAELIWQLFEQTGYLTYCSGLDDAQQRVANLIYLHERAGQFGTFQRQGLYRFLRFMQSLRQEQDLARPSIAGESEQVVRIMSIHRAKGLEFPVVFLPDLGKKLNLSDATGSILVDRAAKLGMEVADEARLIRYPSLSYTLVRRSLLQQTVAEELRLLYVAMTRAKEHLVMVGTCAQSALDKWQTLWKDCRVPMPPDAALGASCVLDWIGPVEAMTASATPRVFEVVRHIAAELRTWQNPADHRPAFSAHQEQLARLEILDPAPTPDSAATRVIQRFQNAYPFDAQTRQAAAASVTSLAKAHGGAALGGAALGPEPVDSLQRKLDFPEFFVAQSVPKPTDVGTATHLLLQHLDFASAGEPGDLQRQIDAMQSARLISARQAKLVDLGTVQWLLESELGALLRTHRQNLMREVPFALARCPDGCAPANGGDPMDLIMVRGRIDLLLPLPEGLAIVDYKTDNLTREWIAQRADSYRAQMGLYREAIERVAAQKVAAVHLVFLSARHMMQL